MGEIGSNTGGVDNVVEGQLIDMRAGLEQQRQRLWGEQSVSQRSHEISGQSQMQKSRQYLPGQCHQRHPRRLYRE